MPWINEIESPKREILFSVVWANSGKGLILKTANYSCFLWKDSKLCLYLINALNLYSQEERNQAIQVVPRKEVKEGFSLEPVIKSSPTDFYWYVNGNGWIYGKKQYLEDPFGLIQSP